MLNILIVDLSTLINIRYNFIVDLYTLVRISCPIILINIRNICVNCLLCRTIHFNQYQKYLCKNIFIVDLSTFITIRNIYVIFFIVDLSTLINIRNIAVLSILIVDLSTFVSIRNIYVKYLSTLTNIRNIYAKYLYQI